MILRGQIPRLLQRCRIQAGSLLGYVDVVGIRNGQHGLTMDWMALTASIGVKG